jgi:hypothetical protein
MDGELAGPVMDRMRIHLGKCPVCRSSLEKIESANALMLEIPGMEPSADFDLHFQEKLAALTAPDAPKPGIFHSLWTFLSTTWRPYALGTAAAGALAFFILTGSNDSGLAVEEIFLAENLEILQEYELVSNLEFFENLDLIETMKVY